MPVTIKIHESYRNVVALADLELIGKKFKEGKKVLDVRESFYKGKDLDSKEIEKILRKQMIEDATFNIVGKESIEIALKSEIISEESVSEIEGIPFALKLI
jgi:hypothetical protein